MTHAGMGMVLAAIISTSLEMLWRLPSCLKCCRACKTSTRLGTEALWACLSAS